jgi:hypothetical protein
MQGEPTVWTRTFILGRRSSCRALKWPDNARVALAAIVNLEHRDGEVPPRAGRLDRSGERRTTSVQDRWQLEFRRDRSHGTVFAMRMLKMREEMEAMKEIWTRQRSNGPSRRHPANALWPRCDRRPW